MPQRELLRGLFLNFLFFVVVLYLFGFSFSFLFFVVFFFFFFLIDVGCICFPISVAKLITLLLQRRAESPCSRWILKGGGPGNPWWPMASCRGWPRSREQTIKAKNRCWGPTTICSNTCLQFSFSKDLLTSLVDRQSTRLLLEVRIPGGSGPGCVSVWMEVRPEGAAQRRPGLGTQGPRR